MPQDSLLIAIEEDGLAQVSCILKEAGDAAEGILKAALEEASSLRQARIAGLREDLLKKKASLLSGAGTRMASLMTEARRAAIEGALVEAVESFKDMAREDYGRTLNIFCMELINEWERDKIDGPPVALVNPADSGLIKKTGLEVRPDPSVSLGVVFISRDGRFRYENTIFARLQRARRSAALAVGRILF